MKVRKLGEATINGRQVSFFSPPHTETDLPWIDALELARAFLQKPAAIALLKGTQRFDSGKATKTIRSGVRLTTIIPHALAQGLTGAIDKMLNGADEYGPAWTAYTEAMTSVAKEHWAMSVEQMIEAFHNQGGPFLRG